MLSRNIESILLAAGRSVRVSELAKWLEVDAAQVHGVLEDLARRFNRDDSGIHLLYDQDQVRFITNPEAGDVVRVALEKDRSAALTRPSLETLTVIAYLGPVTKPEIEQVRGVNCSLILRNLLIRGLITEERDVDRLQFVYAVSNQFKQELGIKREEELPQYEQYHHHQHVRELLSKDPEEEVEL